MLNKTLAQLVVIAYSGALAPLFIVGLLLGFVLMSFKAGYFWGEKWASELFTYATGRGETWIARIND